MKRSFLILADYEEKKKNQRKGKVGQKHWELVRINCDNSDSWMELRVRKARKWTCKLDSHLFNGGQRHRKVRFITESKTSGCIFKFIWKLFGPGIFCRSCYYYKFNFTSSDLTVQISSFSLILSRQAVCF